MKKRMFLSVVFIAVSANLSLAQSGNGFEITQSVIASGGGQNSANGNFSVSGTIGQSFAGARLIGEGYILSNGFWASGDFSPTAALVLVSGRVRTANGSGIRNALVTLTDLNGTVKSATTATFGYFRFENVSVGETYVIAVFSKRFAFSQPSFVRFVSEEVRDIEFVADLSELSRLSTARFTKP